MANPSSSSDYSSSSSSSHSSAASSAASSPPPTHPVILLTTPSPEPAPPPPPPPPRSSRTPSPKRRRVRSPLAQPSPSSPAAPAAPPTESATCPICFETLTNGGSHQIVCMPCGHIFGYKCIRQWLSSGSANRFCPSCKTPAKVCDLRYIFGLPESATVADVAALRDAKAQLAREKVAHAGTKARVADFRSLITSLRRKLRDLERANAPPSVATFGVADHHAAKLTRGPVLVATRVTNGGSTAMAFDDDASFVFSERYSRSLTNPRHKVTRVPLGQPMLGSVSPCAIEKRVNEIAVCKQDGHLLHRYIAVARTDRKVSILAPALQHATDLTTPGIPLSCAWLSARPYLLMMGLSNGIICTYDIRGSATTPLMHLELIGQGQRALHSLGEVALTGMSDRVIVAASPVGLQAVTFDGYMGGMMQSSVTGGHGARSYRFLCGMTVAEGLIAVTSRKPGTKEGRVVVHKGLQRDGSAFVLGEVVGGVMEGYVQELPFCHSALLPSGTDGERAVVVTGDGGVAGKGRMWEYGVGEGGVREWRSNEKFLNVGGSPSVDDLGSVKCARAMRLPRTALLPNIPQGTRGIVGCVSDSCIRLYSTGTS